MSGPDGYVHDPDGVNTEEKLNFILEMRAKDPMHCKPYADQFGCEFVAGAKHWGVTDVDVIYALRHAERRPHGFCRRRSPPPA